MQEKYQQAAQSLVLCSIIQRPVFEIMPVQTLLQLCQTNRRFLVAYREHEDLIVQRMNFDMINRCSTNIQLPDSMHEACIERRLKMGTLTTFAEHGRRRVPISEEVYYPFVILDNGKVIGMDKYDQVGGAAETLPENRRYAQVSIGKSHSLGLLDNGQVVGWGQDEFGQASGGAAALPASRFYVQISAGSDYSLGLLDNGQVVGWGDDDDGKASGGAAALPPRRRFVQVSAGVYHSLGLLDNGQVVYWGFDEFGETAAGSTLLLFGRRCVQVSAGHNHSLALLDNGEVIGWGEDHFEQISGSAALPPDRRFVQVRAMFLESVGLLDNGQIVRWGFGCCGLKNVTIDNS